MAGRKKGTPKTGGRAMGTPNRVTKSAQEAIEFAADAAGGQERLAEWIKETPENERTFWTTIYPKLLPLRVNASGGFTAHKSAEEMTDEELEACIRAG